MIRAIRGSVDWLAQQFGRTSKRSTVQQEQLSIIDEVNEARLEWAHAINRLNWVVDPDLIDHAIFALDAAEKKYAYLLRLARNSRVIAEIRF